MRERFRALALPPIKDTDAVVDFDALRADLEAAVVVGDGARDVARIGVVLGGDDVRGGAAGRLLENRGQVVFDVGLVLRAEIFAVARAVVESDVAGKFLRAVDGLAEALADGGIIKRIAERRPH